MSFFLAVALDRPGRSRRLHQIPGGVAEPPGLAEQVRMRVEGVARGL
jgi:hypothetical protein